MTHLSLFTGIGGFDLGFARCGIHTVAMCEDENDEEKAFIDLSPRSGLVVTLS